MDQRMLEERPVDDDPFYDDSLDDEEEGWGEEPFGQDYRLREVIEHELAHGRLDPVLEEAVRHGATQTAAGTERTGVAAGRLYAQWFLSSNPVPIPVRERAEHCGRQAAVQGFHYSWFAPLLQEHAQRHDAIAGFALGYAIERLSTQGDASQRTA